MSNKIDKEEGLQKFTDPLVTLLEIGKNAMSWDEAIAMGYTKGELLEFMEIAMQELNKVYRAEKPELSLKDKLWDFIVLVDAELGNHSTYDSMKRQRWESNHFEIIEAIDEHVKIYSSPPSPTQLSQKTGLSRVTIYKHLEELNQNPFIQYYNQQYNMLVPSLLNKLYQLGIEQGNVQAIKLFMEMASKPALRESKAQEVEVSRNYIQINNYQLREAELKRLSESKLQELENILREYTRTY